MRALRGEDVMNTPSMNTNGKRKANESSSRARKQVRMWYGVVIIVLLISSQPRIVTHHHTETDVDVDTDVHSSCVEREDPPQVDYETDVDGGPPASSEVEDLDAQYESSDEDEPEVADQYAILVDMTTNDREVSAFHLHKKHIHQCFIVASTSWQIELYQRHTCDLG
jgi:hypothetical protein